MSEKLLRIEQKEDGTFEVISTLYGHVAFTGSISNCYAFIMAKQGNLI